MKQTLLAALLAAVASSAMTLLLTGGLRREPAPTTAAEFRSALADLVREVAALRADLAPPKAPAPPAPVAVLPPVPPEMTPAAPADGELVMTSEIVPVAPRPAAAAEEAPAEYVPPKEPSALPRSADLVGRIRALVDWDESVEIRGKWLLAGEEAVLNAFGKPDDIWIQDSGSESWTYRTPTGERDEEGTPVWKDVTLTLNRGRLVRVDG